MEHLLEDAHRVPLSHDLLHVRVRGEEGNSIYAKEGTLIIYDDAPSHHGRLNRIAPLLENYDKRDEQHKDTPVYDTVYLINFRSPKVRRLIRLYRLRAFQKIFLSR